MQIAKRVQATWIQSKECPKGFNAKRRRGGKMCDLSPRWSVSYSCFNGYFIPFFSCDEKKQKARHARKNSRERSLLISTSSIRSNARLPLDTSSGSRGAPKIKRSLIDNACSKRSRKARVARGRHCQLQTYSLRANSAALVECVNKFPPTRLHEFSHNGP